MPRAPFRADAALRIPAALFSKLARRIAERGEDVFPLHVGDTWMEPFEGGRMEDLSVRDHPDMHHYGETQGLPALVDAIVEKLRTRNALPAERPGGPRHRRRDRRPRRRVRHAGGAGRGDPDRRAVLAADPWHRPGVPRVAGRSPALRARGGSRRRRRRRARAAATAQRRALRLDAFEPDGAGARARGAGGARDVRALRDGRPWIEKAHALSCEAGDDAARVLGVAPPEGACFLFLDVAPRLDARGLAGFLEDCLDDGVVLTPGASCGAGFETHVRLCFTAAPPERVAEAVRRLARRLGRSQGLLLRVGPLRSSLAGGEGCEEGAPAGSAARFEETWACVGRAVAWGARGAVPRPPTRRGLAAIEGPPMSAAATPAARRLGIRSSSGATATSAWRSGS